MNKAGAFDGPAAKEALEQLRQARTGCLTVTDGARDVRLVAGAHEVGLEALGYSLQGNEPRDLIREFLCALFWEAPTYLLEERPPQAREDLPAIRLGEGLGPLLKELGAGLAELSELRRRVHGLDALANVRGTKGPPVGPDEPARMVWETLAPKGERGEVLGVAVAELALDPIDVAWAVADLVDGEVIQLRPAAVQSWLRRARVVEPLAQEGFVPGLRLLHLARLHGKGDKRRAAQLHRQAGEQLLQAARPGPAVDALRTALQLEPDDLAARESLATALERDQRQGEATHVRRDLVDLYTKAGLPGRALPHLQALDDGTVEHKQRLLACVLAMEDVPRAEEMLLRVHALLPRKELGQLPFSFAAAGASPELVARVGRLAGWGRRRRLRFGLWGLALVLLLLALVGLGEVNLRYQLARAVALARGDLDAGSWAESTRHFAELEGRARSLGVADWPEWLADRTCLSRVAEEVGAIEALVEDRAMIAAEASALAWQANPDSRAAGERLDALRKRARSPALGLALQGRVDAVAAWRKQVQERVARLRSLVTGGRRDQALREALELRASHRNARDLWEGESIRVRVAVRPTAGARLAVDGQQLQPVDPAEGEWEVAIPIDGRSGATLVAEAERCLPRSLSLAIGAELLEPTIVLRLFEVTRLVRAEPPARGSEPGLFVFDEEQVLAAAVQALAPGETVALPELRPALEPLLGAIEGSELRLTAWVRSELKGKKLHLTAVDLFLQDPRRANAPAAEPRRVDLGRVARGIQRDGAARLDGLECLGPDGLAYLLETLASVARAMRAELASTGEEKR